MHASVKLDKLEKSEYFNPEEISISGRRFEKFGGKEDDFVKYFLYDPNKSFLLVYMRLRNGEREIHRSEETKHRIRYNAVVILVSETRDTTDEITQNLVPKKLKFRKTAPSFLEKTIESNLSPVFESFKNDGIEVAVNNLAIHLRYSRFA